MPLKLLLASNTNPWETVYQKEGGDVFYRVDFQRQMSFHDREAFTIVKSEESVKAHFRSKVPLGVEESNVAVIQVHDSQPEDEIIIKGAMVKGGSLLKSKPTSGSGWYGTDRLWAWQGPDGQEYRWLVRDSTELLLNNKVIAKFKKESSGILGFGKKPRASLEVFSDVSEAMLDMILTTFVYVQLTGEARGAALSGSGVFKAWMQNETSVIQQIM